MNIKKRILPMMLAILMIFSVMSAMVITVSADPLQRLEVGKEVTVSHNSDFMDKDWVINGGEVGYPFFRAYPGANLFVMTIDFIVECKIHEFEIYGPDIGGYMLEISDDGETWVEVRALAPYTTEVFSTPINTTYLKISMSVDQWGQAKFGNIRVSGIPSTDIIPVRSVLGINGLPENVFFGDTSIATGSVSPTSAANLDCTYESSNTSVMVIDEITGEWEAVGVGTADITATSVANDTKFFVKTVQVSTDKLALLSKNSTVEYSSETWGSFSAGQIINPDNLSGGLDIRDGGRWLKLDFDIPLIFDRISVVTPAHFDRLIVRGSNDNNEWEDITTLKGDSEYLVLTDGTNVGYKVTNEISQPKSFRYLYFTVVGLEMKMSNIQVYGEMPVTGVEIDTAPTKTTYIEGQSFDKTGMVVKSVNYDGTKTVLADEDYKVTVDLKTIGTQTAVVTYKGYTAPTTFTVEVNAKTLLGISAVQKDDAVIYEGDSLNGSNITVYAVYDNGDKIEIAEEDYTVDPEILDTAGYVSAEITAMGKTTMISVDVTALAVTGIEVTGTHRTEYVVGMEFNPDGMIVTKQYNSGKTEETSEYDYDIKTALTEDDDVITVTLTGTDFTAAVELTFVEKTAIGLEITDIPEANLSYIENQSFNLEGATIKLVYNDDTKEDIAFDDEGIVIAPAKLSVGDESVTVSYAGFDVVIDEITVVAKTFVKIEVKTLPDRTEFKVGQTFDATGIVVVAVYDNGEEIVIASEDYVIDTPTFEEADIGDEYEINVTYANEEDEEEGEASFTVKVVEADAVILLKIEIIEPDKKNYIVGDELDTTGMVVKAYYDNDEIVDVTAECTVTPEILNVLGESIEVSVSFGGKTVTFNVKVTEEAAEREIVGIEVSTLPKVEYKVGETFDATGMVVKLVYDNGDKETITEYTVDAPALDAAGKVVITVTYAVDEDTSFTKTFEVTVTDAKLKGDVNGDGSVTITDAIAIFRHLADKVKITDADVEWAADVDGNGKIEILDAINIFRYLADKMTLDELQALYLNNVEVTVPGEDDEEEEETPVETIPEEIV